jgi:hypothetical protein
MKTKLKFLKYLFDRTWAADSIDYFRKPPGIDTNTKNLHYRISTLKKFNDSTETIVKNTAYVSGGVTTAVDALYETTAPKNSIPFNEKNSSFKITVDTTYPAGSATNQFQLPLKAGQTYNCTIFWGDGSSTVQTTTTSPTHTYAQGGVYQITIVGTFPAIFFNNTGDKLKLNSIDNWGSGVWTTFDSAFYGCSNMIGKYTDQPDCTSVTSTLNMFRACYKFNSIFNVPTPAVTITANMFYDCIIFNQPINKLTTNNVTDITGIFGGCFSFNQSVRTISTASATVMNTMFFDCQNFNQPIGHFKFGGSDFSVYMSNNRSFTYMDDLLISLINNPNTPAGRNMNLGSSKYTSAALKAKALLNKASTTKTITNIVSNPEGLVRVTATAHGMATGEMCSITAVVGSTEINRAWEVIVIDRLRMVVYNRKLFIV